MCQHCQQIYSNMYITHSRRDGWVTKRIAEFARVLSWQPRLTHAISKETNCQDNYPEQQVWQCCEEAILNKRTHQHRSDLTCSTIYIYIKCVHVDTVIRVWLLANNATPGWCQTWALLSSTSADTSQICRDRSHHRGCPQRSPTPASTARYSSMARSSRIARQICVPRAPWSHSDTRATFAVIDTDNTSDITCDGTYKSKTMAKNYSSYHCSTQLITTTVEHTQQVIYYSVRTYDMENGTLRSPFYAAVQFGPSMNQECTAFPSR